MSDTQSSSLTHPNSTKGYSFFVWGLTAATLALLQACRTSWAYTKSYIHEYGADSTFDGVYSTLTATFVIIYAVGLLLHGVLERQISNKVLICAGIFLSSSAFAFIPLLELSGEFTAYSLLLADFAIHGFAQSLAIPAAVHLISNTFGQSKSGFLLRLWAFSANIGNIIGTITARSVVSYDWFFAEYILAGLLVFTGIFINRCVENIGKSNENSIVSGVTSLADFREALRLPSITNYLFTFTLLKVVYLAMTFWLPYYLHTVMQLQDDAAIIMIALEFGVIVGTFTLSLFFDRLSRKATFLGFLILGSCILLILESFEWHSMIPLRAAIFFSLGNAIGGALNVIIGVIVPDISVQAMKPQLLPTLYGIFEIFGNVCGAIFLMTIQYFQYQMLLGLAICLMPAYCSILALNSKIGKENVAYDLKDNDLSPTSIEVQ